MFDIAEAIQKKKQKGSTEDYLTTKELLEAIDQAGFRPANLVELLAYAKNNWKPEPEYSSHLLTPEEKVQRASAPYIYAFGSVFSDSDVRRCVPFLCWGGGGRGLRASSFDYRWGSGRRFLVFRKGSS